MGKVIKVVYMSQKRKTNLKCHAASRPSPHPTLPSDPAAANALVSKITEKAVGPFKGNADPETSHYEGEDYLN